jgi:succinyl-diaminopimelate desuccinylase
MNPLRSELTQITCDLVRFISTADRPDQLDATIDYVAAYLHHIPGLFIERSSAGGKPALVATLHDTRSPALMLNGHLDVVVAQPEQFNPVVRDGRIYGRGAQDMKGSVAVMLRLLKDLAALPERPNVGFQFVTDEEIGGMLGTGRLFEEGWHCATHIALEPTDLAILYAHKGGMWVEMRLPGKPGHASRPWDSHNPVHDLTRGLLAMEAHFPTLREEVWHTTVTPTRVAIGGGSRNQIPPEALISFDIRFIPADEPETISAALRTCFPTAEVLTDRAGVGLFTDPEDPSILRMAEVIEARLGAEPRMYREHFATDARFYSAAGTPAFCVGPIGAGLHSDEEWVDIASLEDLYAILWDYSLNSKA